MNSRMKYFTCACRREGHPRGGVNTWPVSRRCPHKQTSPKGRHYIYDVRRCEACTNHLKKGEQNI